jgi:peptide chain release factor 2
VISQRISELHKGIETWDELERGIADAVSVVNEIKSPEEEAAFRPEVEDQMNEIEARFRELEFLTLFDGRYDRKGAILAFHAGAGGTEAQDWAEMLLRMIMRFCERKGFKVKLLNESRGEEAGIKTATIEVEGQWAYGWLKSEHGVHRLVRLSPYNADQLRQTSFADIEVIPDLGDAVDVKIDPKDLRIDTYLAGGHGGQSVQTTYSAVRIVHLPTGIMVTCQNERSQLQNREVAMKLLKAKLAAIEIQKQEAERLKLRGEYHSAAWGNQIRSYVLQPYKMVRDHRTKLKLADAEKVLDGALEPFVEAYLKWSKDPADYLASHAAEAEEDEE